MLFWMTLSVMRSVGELVVDACAVICAVALQHRAGHHDVAGREVVDAAAVLAWLSSMMLSWMCSGASSHSRKRRPSLRGAQGLVLRRKMVIPWCASRSSGDRWRRRRRRCCCRRCSGHRQRAIVDDGAAAVTEVGAVVVHQRVADHDRARLMNSDPPSPLTAPFCTIRLCNCSVAPPLTTKWREPLALKVMRRRRRSCVGRNGLLRQK